MELPFFVSPAGNVGQEICASMKLDHQTVYSTLDDLALLLEVDRPVFYRELCAFEHLHTEYFQSAESDEWLDVFWGKNSVFFHMFQQLDLSNVIELACGQGRHVPQYIELCKIRFQDHTHIHYYCNNGYNLQALESEQYSSLFSYDAVVHFEMLDIYEYLKDIYRVLVPGGMVLIHHSNTDNDYKISFHSGVYNRNFMSKKLFAYLSYRAGFEVVKQKVIDWGLGEELRKNLDCITLLRKTNK